MRRITALMAAWVVVAGIASNAQAASLITYQLVNTANAGTPAVTQIAATILPTGSIAPASPDVSPLAILPGSTGFDTNNLKVLLGDGTSPTGDPLQALALDFGDKGFAPGGVLNFSLSLDANYKGDAPQLILPPGTSGLKLNPYTPPPTTPTNNGPGGGPTTTPTNNSGGTGAGGVTQVPEPISIFLWSAVAGAGIIRARVFRRARRRV